MSLDLTSNFHQFNFGMGNLNGHSIYAFGEFRLNAEKLMLYKGSAEISLSPKVIRTLVVLVENAGQILSKDELMERVWEDSIVEEANLSQYLYLLRKTLGRTPDGRPYIETLRRRGYRFNGDVEITQPLLKEYPRQEPMPVTSSGQSVERQGNVLRLVEWTPEVERGTASAPVLDKDVPSALPTGRRFGGVALAALLVAAFVTSMALYLWSRSNGTSQIARGEMTNTRLTNGGMPMSAAISRDGKYIAYTETENETSQIWLQSVGQSSRIKVTESKDKVFGGKTFSPDGRFIYYSAWDRNNFSTAAVYRIATIGEPSTKVLEGTVAAVSFSPDGEQMAFIKSLPDKGHALTISDKDGGDQKTVLTAQTPDYLCGSPAWSPDGERIVFGKSEKDPQTALTRARIYVVEISSGAISEFSHEKWDTVWRMDWMPDGKGVVLTGTKEDDSYTTRRDQVYYITYPDGASHRVTTSGIRHEPSTLNVTEDGGILALSASRSSQIWSMDASGRSNSAVQISRGLYDGRPGLAPMPDGQLAYMTYTSDDPAIWLMNANGTEQRQITNGTMFVEELRGDPLGRYFFFSSFRDKQNHLYRIDTDGQNLKQITFGDGREIDSAVSPDGNWVYYASYTDSDNGHSVRLYRSSIDGGQPEPVGNNECTVPSISSDGKYLACVTEDEHKIYIVSLDSGERMRKFDVAPYPTINIGVRWLPDNSGIAYIRYDKAGSNLWIQPLDGTPLRQMTDFTSGFIYNFAFSADGTRIFLGRGYPIQDVFLIKNFR